MEAVHHMLQINQIIISGNLTVDPEVKSTNSGTPVCNFAIANNRIFKTKQGVQRLTNYVHVSCFGKLAENVGKYCEKGSGVVVIGELVMDSWEVDGKKRERLKINANNVQFMPRRQNADAEAEQEEANGTDDPF